MLKRKFSSPTAPESDLDDFGDISDIPAPPYALWPTLAQEAAQQQLEMLRQSHQPKEINNRITELSDNESSSEASTHLVEVLRKRRRLCGRRRYKRASASVDSSSGSELDTKQMVSRLALVESIISRKSRRTTSSSQRQQDSSTSRTLAVKHQQSKLCETFSNDAADGNNRAISSSLAAPDALNTSLLLAIGMLCAKTDSHELFIGILRRQKLDPLAVALYAFFAWYIGVLMRTIPKKLSLLTDDSMMFEDALGTTIQLPYSTYSHVRLFRAFLEVHFEGKPGLQKVMGGEYQLLDRGNSQFRVISEECWNRSISKRMRVVMNMLFAMNDMICVSCSKQLDVQGSDNYCESCGYKFHRAEPVSGQTLDSLIAAMDVESTGEQDRHFTSKDPRRRSRQPQCPRLPYKNMSLIMVSNDNRAALSLDNEAGASRPHAELTAHELLGAHSRNQQVLHDALSFLDKFKYRYALQPELYDQFLDIMGDFKAGSTTAKEIHDQVKQLLGNDGELMEDFEQFLPEGMAASSTRSDGVITNSDLQGELNQQSPYVDRSNSITRLASSTESETDTLGNLKFTDHSSTY